MVYPLIGFVPPRQARVDVARPEARLFRQLHIILLWAFAIQVSELNQNISVD